MRNLPDRELFGLVQQADEKAFAVLVDRYSKILFRHINKRTNSQNDSQEILQNIFLSLWKNRVTINISDTIFPYLYKAAKYEVINWSIKTEKALLRESLLLKREIGFELPAEEIIIAEELNDFLTNEVAKMPSTMQAIFKLSREECMSTKEIAQYLCISEQTVKNNITLALQRLRQSLNYKHYVVIAGILIASLR